MRAMAERAVPEGTTTWATSSVEGPLDHECHRSPVDRCRRRNRARRRLLR